MAMQHLGEQFDIHGGGLDLQFPHHENEIAQSEGATGKPFANYWLHVGMLQVNGEKMSKSLGNFYTIDDVLKKHHPEVVRYFLLSNHYRSPLNYTEDNLHNAGKGLMRLYQALRDIAYETGTVDTSWVEQFNHAMNDDINTPVALSVLFQLSHVLNKNRSPHLAVTLKHLGSILGLLQENPETFLQQGLTIQDTDHEHIHTLIAQREQARSERDWSRADAIRQTLDEQGIELEDTPSGTTWRRK
jgi:cysteinyl-tRNA synthetase